MNKKVKIGVLGARRGRMMMRYCLKSDDAELVAICDYSEKARNECKKEFGRAGKNVQYFADFDTFLTKGGMDAVVLANYANDHCSYAVKCLDAGLHVMSEVLPVETLKEGVELVEAVERSGKVYSYAENYCFFSTTNEMKRLFADGTLGEFEYGESEYIHNCEPSWLGLTGGANPEHWRNVMSAFYYCTHSAGPIIHATGLRPVKVSGTEGPYNDRMKGMGAGGAAVSVSMVTLENGGIYKCTQGLGLSNNSIWYSVYGTKGKAETAREYAGLVNNPLSKLYLLHGNRPDSPYTHWLGYRPYMDKRARSFGHSGSDWFTMHNFVKKIKGEPCDIVDVYEALDMFFVGYFGFLSALHGKETEIPNFRLASVREKYRNDTACCNPKKAGDMLLPSNTSGGVNCSPETYEKLKLRVDGRGKHKVMNAAKGLLWKISFVMKAKRAH